MLTLARTEAFLTTFPRLTIGLVGDLFLDRYLHLVPGVAEMSIETGLEAYQIERVRNSPGALGTVMNNLAALGVGLLVPVSVIGDDGHGYDLLREVRKLPVDATHLLCRRDRLTPTYTKPLRMTDGGHWHELNRLDVRTRAPLSTDATEILCQHLRDVFRTSDGLIVLDQVVQSDEGVVNAGVRQTLEELAGETPGKLMFVDSRAHLGLFHSATLKGNRAELLRCAEAEASADANAVAIAATLARRNQRPVFCTQGTDGIAVALPAGEHRLAPGVRVSGPVDIVGAGDAATSGIVTSLLAGASPLEAAMFGNLVASITVQQLGTTGTASPQQILERWRAWQMAAAEQAQ